MSKPVGGRGIKAPYESTHVRVPIPVKAEVEAIIERFRDGLNDPSISVKTFEQATEAAKAILVQKKSARVSMQKLLTSIYGIDAIL